MIIAFFIVLLIMVVTITLTVVMFTKQDSTTNSTNVLLRCPIGYCATNILSGDKRCSDFGTDAIANANDGVIYDPTLEVCNPLGFCTNSRTPFAERGDGSTASDGQCETIDTPCRCLRTPKCASFHSNYFEYSLITSSSLNDINNGSITIKEGNTGVEVSSSLTTSANSLNSAALSCTIPGAAITNVIAAPYCPCTIPGNTNISCIGLTPQQAYAKCIRSNPCPDGVMAVMVNNYTEVNTFELNDVTWTSANLGCVKGYPIDNSGSIEIITGVDDPLKCLAIEPFIPLKQWYPIYDKSTHKVYCKNIP